ncbi:oligosaccharide flippase family protein [uncultured Methanomethylovorans sp.]|uniref:oligosaccharide flippase family protein n=1 Tax=uncultured Methanomethylovorans sp. TaxID=183759 RepID=UPI002AA8447B|nr:oligosaccharide flippase family protein [uncultured Methanomethylovorans sp.]
MKQTLSSTFWYSFSIVYERVLHEKLSLDAKGFLNNIFYVGGGVAIATAFSFLFNILSGRWLGPSLYGEYALVETVSMFLYIPMLMGYHASMVKYNAEKKNHERQQSIISTTYLLVLAFTITSVLIYLIFSSQITTLLSISGGLYYYSILYAVLFVVYTITTETLKSLHELKKYSFIKPVFSFILLISFLYFMAVDFISSKSMIFSMYIAYGVTSVILLYLLRKYFIFKLEKKWISQLTKYSFYSLMGGLSFVLYTNIDKILINVYMNLADVGIYRAYNYAFISIIQVLIITFGTVFFPYASMSNNKRMLFSKINKLIPYFIILGLPLAMISGFIVLSFYGNEYEFNLKLALLFGVAGLCIAIDNLYGQLMSSIGIKGIKIVSFAAVVMALTNTFLNMWLIPLMGIEGAVIATTVSFLVSISIMLSKRSYIYNSEGYDVGN